MCNVSAAGNMKAVKTTLFGDGKLARLAAHGAP
jgi:hypothetical protein